ncbi:MAG: glycosyltransferase family 4 protein [Bacteroidetes bacterium]|nr:glycosyltransferase family 4 protein [Bacteroidota bacterium]
MLKDKKKVIITGSIPPPFHGSTVYLKNLLDSKLRDEFEVYHHDISDHRDIKNLSRLDTENVRLALKSIKGIRSIVKNIKPDIVYIPVASNFLPYLRDGSMILSASSDSRAKIIIHLHEGDYFRKVFYENSLPPVKYFIKKSLSKVHTAIVYSESLKSNFEGLVKNIVSFPNGADFEVTGTAGRIRKNHDGKFNFSFYANLYESKGILDFLNAAVILTEKNIDAEFHIAGEYPDGEKDTELKVKKIISEGGISDRVFFHGVVSGKSKMEFLDKTDILIHPTWYPYEGCPMAIIEAFANAIPVISIRDTGAVPEMIDDGRTGILVSRKNPEEIAAAVVRLAGNSELRENISEACRNEYKNRFTAEININNIITTFKKALN